MHSWEWNGDEKINAQSLALICNWSDWILWKRWFIDISIYFPLLSLLLLLSHSVLSDSLWCHGLQHARLLCPSPSPRACSNSCPSNLWCHTTISSSVTPFSSCLQSFPASGFFAYQWLKDLRDICKCVRLVMNWWSNGKKRMKKESCAGFPFWNRLPEF